MAVKSGGKDVEVLVLVVGETGEAIICLQYLDSISIKVLYRHMQKPKNRQCPLRLLPYGMRCNLAFQRNIPPPSSGVFPLILKVDSVCSPKKLLPIYQIKRRHIPEDNKQLQ
jgi:hypothetical protein